jgi:hypothetical protein
MLYLVRVRGFSVNSAAGVLSEVVPDLGDAEAIRSIYREQNGHRASKHLMEFFRKIEKAVDSSVFEEALALGIGAEFEELRKVKKPRRGRPPKK